VGTQLVPRESRQRRRCGLRVKHATGDERLGVMYRACVAWLPRQGRSSTACVQSMWCGHRKPTRYCFAETDRGGGHEVGTQLVPRESRQRRRCGLRVKHATGDER